MTGPRLDVEGAALDAPALEEHDADIDPLVLGGGDAVFLDVHNRLITEREIFRGTLHRAAVEPRAVLKEALWCRASYFVLFHNHPSDDPTPSAEDIAFTRRMDLAGKLLGIKMVDHVVVGNGDRWVSLKRRGW